jgi:hypothetical protein
MPSFTKETLVKTVSQLRAGLTHAFATRSPSPALSVEDVELLDRVANSIVSRGMAAPAVVFLESLGPMNFLGSQALHFLTPVIELAFNAREVEQVARLLERRDTVTRLIALLEAKSPR